MSGWFQRALEKRAPEVRAAIAQAVEMEAAIVEELKDLDLLDDPDGHAYCTYCNAGRAQALDIVVSICGKRSVVPLYDVELTCAPCRAAFESGVCPRHGYVGRCR